VSLLLNRRSDFMKNFPTEKPSQLAKPSQLPTLQNSVRSRLYCDRPKTLSPTVPITLLHPIFNQLLSDCTSLVPSPRDNEFALKLSDAMSDFYASEDGRKHMFIRVCGEFDIPFAASEVVNTKFKTDGDQRFSSLLSCITEHKNDIGSTGAEPVFQAALYYTHQLKHSGDLSLATAFPCLGIYNVGMCYV
jgi:hypothetical protein